MTASNDGAILRLCRILNADRCGDGGTWDQLTDLADDARLEQKELRARLAASEVRVVELLEEVARHWTVRDARSADLGLSNSMRVEAVERAEAAEKREAELSDALDEVVRREDAKLKEARANGLRERERDQQEEAALPACVRAWRELNEPTQERAIENLDGHRHAARCMFWLATAQASQVARLGLDGDALRAVRRWCEAKDWYREDCLQTLLREAPQKDGIGWLIQVGEKLAGATLYDVGDLKPLLRAVRGLLGDGYPDSKSRLDAAWDALPPEWRKLAEEP